MTGPSEKLDRLSSALQAIVLEAALPVLLWSGGADSTLLVYLMQKIAPETAIVQFRDEWREEQIRFSDSVIKDLKLKVYVYAPADRFLVPASEDGEELALVSDYSIGDAVLPFVRDIVFDRRACVLDLAGAPRTPAMAFPYDAVITGFRSTDTHFAMGDNFRMHPKTIFAARLFAAPLFDWTRENVLDACRELQIPLSEFYTGERDDRFDTGNLLACDRCVSKPDGTSVFCHKSGGDVTAAGWDKQKTLESFRKRFD